MAAGLGVLGPVVDLQGRVPVVGEVRVAPAAEEAAGLHGRAVALVVDDERAAAGPAGQADAVGDLHAALRPVVGLPLAPDGVVLVGRDADAVRVAVAGLVEADAGAADRVLHVRVVVAAGAQHDERVVAAGA